MNYKKFKSYSNTFVFDTWIVWNTITIFWWIHWNEKVWIDIIDKLVEKIQKWDINILKWKLILAYWNEKAIKLWKKEYKYNLNRLFKKEHLESNSNEYEIDRVKQLADIMNYSDILLDIHSVSSDSEPFMFCENIKNEIDIIKSIYNWKIILWWWDISWNLISWDADSYMHSLWKIGFTLECGNHNCDNAFYIWYKTTLSLLNKLGFLKIKLDYIENKKNCFIKMYKIKTTKTWFFRFNWKIQNFKSISKWELIWFDWEEKVLAKEDFIILLPNFEKIKKWEEIFYYWKLIK